MKTTYLSKTKFRRRASPLPLITVSVVAVLIILTGLFSQSFFSIMTFLTGATSNGGQTASTFSSFFSSQSDLKNEIEKLKEENSLLTVQLSDRDMLLKENADLRAGAFLEEETGRIAAKLISKPPFTPFDVFVINKGESHGIRDGARVMIGETWIGTISKVESATAHITLLSNSQSETAVLVGDKAVPAVLKGKGGGNFGITLPQGSQVANGDFVFSASTSESYFIGKVGHIEDNNDNTLISVLVSFPFSMYDVSYVEIISS
jgi:cell shape-determining protein MreC